MPVMDGMEATVKIREMEANGQLSLRNGRTMPIVALTANAMRGDRDACTSVGMNGYVTKPIDRKELLDVVAAHLNPLGIDNVVSKTIEAKAPEGDQPRPLAASSFEMDELLARCGGDQAFTSRLLGKFASRLSQEQSKLSETVSKRAAEEAAKVAHTLKGTAGNVSATAIQKLASELEESIKTESWEAVAPQMDQLDREIFRCLEEINSMVQVAISHTGNSLPQQTPTSP